MRWILDVLVVFSALAAAVCGLCWYKDARQKREQARQAFQATGQEVDEKARLALLGNIDIELDAWQTQRYFAAAASQTRQFPTVRG
jgi:hypothetical protein